MLNQIIAATLLANCPLSRAEYAYQGDRGISANFDARARSSDGSRMLRIVFSDKAANVSYSAQIVKEGAGAGPDLYVQGLKDENKHKALDASVLSEQKNIYFFNRLYRVEETLNPRTVEIAPARIFVPGLQSLFWYSDYNHRVAIAIGILNLRACNAHR